MYHLLSYRLPRILGCLKLGNAAAVSGCNLLYGDGWYLGMHLDVPTGYGGNDLGTTGVGLWVSGDTFPGDRYHHCPSCFLGNVRAGVGIPVEIPHFPYFLGDSFYLLFS